MLFPALGAVTAMWLVLCPFLDLETGYRAVLATWVGGGALVLAPLGIWFRQARWASAALGTLLGVVALFDPPALGGLANFIACGSALVVAGMAPQPVVEVTGRTGAVPSAAEDGLEENDTARLVRAA